jgi:tetratricopeptide (TPR) repeat protein
MRAPLIVPSATFQKVLRDEAGLNEYIGLDESELTAVAALAANLYEQGRIAEARTIFEGLTALDGDFYRGHAGLGALALIEGDPETAMRSLARAAELCPGDASVLCNLGEAYLQRAEFTEAARCFERALALDPDGSDPGANRTRAIIAGLQRAAGAASTK